MIDTIFIHAAIIFENIVLFILPTYSDDNDKKTTMHGIIPYLKNANVCGYSLFIPLENG
ncbi:MAG: hypothetical protein ACK5C0_00105 [Candidatus Kapaibacterium sp.]